MLKKSFRIRKNKEFMHVYKKGKAYFSPSVVMYISNNSTKQMKFGFSVSKKIGKATVRNTFKRKLREICRINIPQLKEGYDIIFVARAGIVKKTYQEISQEMVKHFRNARLKKCE
jgi:ribonuclease P protein component